MYLSDCFTNVIAYVTLFLETTEPEQGEFEKVQNDILKLLNEGDAGLDEGRFSREDYTLAKFAVCAWIDERILESAWPHKNRWQRQLLQRRFFDTANAGEEFFEKMNSLGPHQREVREIYFLCLCLGFKGRYCNPEDEYLLEQLQASNLKLLLGASTSLPRLEDDRLFPEAYPRQPASVESSGSRSRITPVTLGFLVAPVLLFAVLFVIYHFILSGVGANVVAQM